MLNSVYITKISKFLPNAPIDNLKMTDYLGMIGGKPSKSQKLVLKRNGIKTRYYALDEDRNVTHTNADMAAEAVKNLAGNGFDIQQLELPQVFLHMRLSLLYQSLFLLLRQHYLQLIENNQTIK